MSVSLPPPALRFRSEYRSHRGMVRNRNEDALLGRPEHGLWAVADGMAGHHRGDEASHAAVSALSDCLDGLSDAAPPSTAIKRVETAIRRVHTQLRAEARRCRVDVIGTTVAVMVTRGLMALVLWAGDSRVYLQRAGRLTCITEDHTAPGGALSRAVGAGETCWLDTRTAQLMAHDRLLLCSDGLTKELSDDDLNGHLSANGGLARCADTLLNTALHRDARDNVSFILVEAL